MIEKFCNVKTMLYERLEIQEKKDADKILRNNDIPVTTKLNFHKGYAYMHISLSTKLLTLFFIDLFEWNTRLFSESLNDYNSLTVKSRTVLERTARARVEQGLYCANVKYISLFTWQRYSCVIFAVCIELWIVCINPCILILYWIVKADPYSLVKNCG